MQYSRRKTEKTLGNRGFTLVETLVAVSVFSFSVLGLLVLLANGVANTAYAKKKAAASYLAAEGVEYVRNLRDTYVLYSGNPATGWSSFKSKLSAASCSGANGCYFDDRNVSFTDTTLPMTDLTFAACANSTCTNAPLLYDSTSGKYGYVSGSTSGFSRKINMVQLSADEVRIFSTVYWTQGSGTYSSVFSESLFNWVE